VVDQGIGERHPHRAGADHQVVRLHRLPHPFSS